MVMSVGVSMYGHLYLPLYKGCFLTVVYALCMVYPVQSSILHSPLVRLPRHKSSHKDMCNVPSQSRVSDVQVMSDVYCMYKLL
ncbi:hypothetical protein K504DRAFT_94532 [Pleomassaria siparia CBS 279.74]|uniref:Uncharacterized protein n=1 Tax=Pleomassaria siparia CBS 279.74 TaxID=1314801 RepID=A0A6G1JYH1_9PLEO|nr:hypothetical protein K504DRAFT_94532 [Pleomassaria siparia CBS 279.74]